MGFKPRNGYPKQLSASLSSVLASLLLAATGLSAFAALSPEQETRKLARTLKPISDQVWAQIAGERATQQYSVVKGDNLYDVSKRLFGDPKYWPKIWAINNGKIINPHLIFPGKQVAFLSGSGTSLPSVGVQNGNGGGGDAGTATDAEPEQLFGAGRSQEWQSLPHQDWEDATTQLPPNIDPQGFDKSSRIKFSESTGAELQGFISDSEIPFVGELNSATRYSSGLTLGDVVYIKPLRELQVGQVYTITNEPVKISGPRTHRRAFSYLNGGKMRIISVRDGIFVGTITQSFQAAARGHYLVPEVKRVHEPELIPGTQPLQANIILDPRVNSKYTVQFKQIYVDRGADDGVKPGMVFRSYDHDDPNTGRTITNSDFIVHSDFMVMETYEHFCVAWAMNGVDSTIDRAPVVLLTDISDLLRGQDFEAPPETTDQIDKDLDELDGLDPGGDLGEKEKRELKQLEKWKEDKIKGEGDVDAPPPAGDLQPPGEAAPEAVPEAAPEAAPQEIPPADGEAPIQEVPSEPQAEPLPPASGEPAIVQPESPAEGGVAPTAPVENKEPAAPPPEAVPEAVPSLPDEPPPPPTTE